MIVRRIVKPFAKFNSDYDKELWDQLERFSYDVNLMSTLLFGINKETLTSDAELGTKNVIFIDATSGDVTVTLPALSKSDGVIYWIKRLDSSGNTVTVDGNGSETIDGSLTLTLTQYDVLVITPSNSEWSKLT